MDWKQRIRAAFDADSLPDDDVVDELTEHAAAAYQAALADGRDPAEAERQVAAEIAAWARDPAVRRRRSPRSARDIAQPAATSRLVGLAHDLRQATRLLRRQPGYSAIAILTMALGIGATTSLFSVAYGVLLKPLPWPDADRLVRLYETRRGGTSRLGSIMTSLPYLAWHEHPTTIDALAAWSPARVTIGSPGDLVRAPIAGVTASLFPLLSARPERGALFTERDETLKQQPPAIISYGLWQERYGFASDVIGRAIRFNGKPYRIAAVMPKSFAFPDRETRAWIPFAVRSQKGGLSIFAAIARLKRGVTPAQAAAEAMARARGVPDPGAVVLAVFGSKGAVEISAVPLLESQVASVRPAILVFLVAVGLLLATATANVASIQLARAAARRREIAIRSALGAGAAPLIRQFLVESMIVGACGGLAGLVLATAALRLLPSVLPPGFPRVADVTMNVPAAAFAIGMSLLASVLFGLWPALQARTLTLTPSLAEDGLAPAGDGLRLRAGRTRAAIIAGQIAIACVLLVGTALLARSFVALLKADRGYDPTNVLTAVVPLPDDRYTSEQRATFMTDLIERLRALPGIRHAAFATALPLTAGDILASFPVHSGKTGATVQAHAVSRVVTPDYFATLGIRLVEGRPFDDRDASTSPPVVVVNRAFVREYLRAHPIGDKLFDDSAAGPGPTIVGVIEDVHHRSVTDPFTPEIYSTSAQSKELLRYDRLMLAIRTAGDPATFATTLRAIVRQRDPAVALDSIAPMEDLFRTSLAEPRLYSMLLAALGMLALVIAAVGLFGVLIYTVGQRSREIGVRAALGARPLDIVALVLRQGLGIAVVGLAVGLGVAFALAKSLSTFLYGVTAYDTASFVLVPIVLLIVSGLACVVPARRAAKVDPVRVIRGQV